MTGANQVLDVEAQPAHYLLCTQRTIPRVGVRRYPAKPMSGHAAHDWWYLPRHRRHRRTWHDRRRADAQEPPYRRPARA